MSEYPASAWIGFRPPLELVLALFSTLAKDESYAATSQAKPDLLQHATTAHSFQRIVTYLANPEQIKVVTGPPRS